MGWDALDDLSKEELLDLLKKYSDYLMSAEEEGLYDAGWRPVCAAEFYECEYQATGGCRPVSM